MQFSYNDFVQNKSQERQSGCIPTFFVSRTLPGFPSFYSLPCHSEIPAAFPVTPSFLPYLVTLSASEGALAIARDDNMRR